MIALHVVLAMAIAAGRTGDTSVRSVYLATEPTARAGGGEYILAIRSECSPVGADMDCRFWGVRITATSTRGCSVSSRMWRGVLSQDGVNRWRGIARGGACGRWAIRMSIDPVSGKWRYEARDVSAQSDTCPPPQTTADIATEYASPFTFPSTEFECERIIGLAP